MNFRELLEKEVKSHKDLSHPNIIKFLAMVFDIGTPEKPGSCGIVMEYMEHGDLETYLQEHELNYGDKKQFISNVANGVCYLHSLKPPLIHGDLKIQNVLIESEKKAKVPPHNSSV